VYLRGRAPIDPTGHDAVVVDDGVATGSSMLAAVRALKRRGARRVVVATPVAPPDTIAKLEAEADLVVCLLQPDWFGGVGAFYRDFHQLEDDEVVELMDAAAQRVGQVAP
jgi:putative phosphoribosyl transferase